MTKKTAVKKPETNEDFFDVELPVDGQEILGDVNGYIDFDRSAVKFTPSSVKMFDGNMDASKPGILIIGKLDAPALVYLKEGDDDESERVYRKAEKGEPVGVWFKPDLRKMRDKCGVSVYIKKVGEKDTGKPNPMTVFKVVAPVGGSRIPVTEDARVKSKHVKTPFDVITVGRKPVNDDTDFNPEDFEDME